MEIKDNIMSGSNNIFNTVLKHKLIGIGEFSHGIQQSWEFRFSLLKYTVKYTNKKIFIFIV